MTTLRWTLAGIGVAVVLGTVVAAAQQGARGGEWTRYGGDAGTTKYAPLDQINKDNVSRLRIAWRRPARRPEHQLRRSRTSPIRATSARRR